MMQKTQIQQQRPNNNTCFLCGAPLSAGEGFHFIMGPEKKLYLDVSERLLKSKNQQGARVCVAPACTESAFIQNGLKQSFGPLATQVTQAYKAYLNKLFGLLNLLRKGGRVVLGTTKILEALGKGKVCLVLCAEDAGKNSVKMLETRLSQPLCKLGTKVNFEKAFMKENCITLAALGKLEEFKSLKQLIGKVIVLKSLLLVASHVTNNTK